MAPGAGGDEWGVLTTCTESITDDGHAFGGSDLTQQIDHTRAQELREGGVNVRMRLAGGQVSTCSSADAHLRLVDEHARDQVEVCLRQLRRVRRNEMVGVASQPGARGDCLGAPPRVDRRFEHQHRLTLDL